jgi:hypothetical protein
MRICGSSEIGWGFRCFSTSAHTHRKMCTDGDNATMQQYGNAAWGGSRIQRSKPQAKLFGKKIVGKSLEHRRHETGGQRESNGRHGEGLHCRGAAVAHGAWRMVRRSTDFLRAPPIARRLQHRCISSPGGIECQDAKMPRMSRLARLTARFRHATPLTRGLTPLLLWSGIPDQGVR